MIKSARGNEQDFPEFFYIIYFKQSCKEALYSLKKQLTLFTFFHIKDCTFL